MEALRLAEAELTVYVHPSNANRVRHAVNSQLSALLFTYDDHFDGVLLTHEVAFHVGKDKDDKTNNDKDENGEPKHGSGEPKDESGEPKSCAKGKIKDGGGEPKGESGEPKDETGKPKKTCVKGIIMNGLVPYFSVQVHAMLLLFSPQPDMILEGKVEMLGKESIHAIVLGVFSVAIMSEDIREKFKFRVKNGERRFVSRTDKHHVIKRGTMIRFSVKRVDTEMNCHITGSLIPCHTGCMRWLSVHDTEYASELKRGEDGIEDTSMKIQFPQNEQEHRMLKNEDGMVKSERKSRKRRHIEE